eukprot:1175474-Prorocentrum_minimum.AAC.3
MWRQICSLAKRQRGVRISRFQADRNCNIPREEPFGNLARLKDVNTTCGTLRDLHSRSKRSAPIYLFK